jgi:hypothetical protein
MAQQTDRFAVNPWNGVRQLTAIGCFESHDTPRDDQLLKEFENKIQNFETYIAVEREERMVVNKLAMYFSQGYKLRPNESAEDFIARCEGNYETLQKGAQNGIHERA